MCRVQSLLLLLSIDSRLKLGVQDHHEVREDRFDQTLLANLLKGEIKQYIVLGDLLTLIANVVGQIHISMRTLRHVDRADNV